MRLIGTPASPALLDVSLDEDFTSDPTLIPTARRWPHSDSASAIGWLAGRKVVVICQKGLKLSHGAAALLRTHGVDAEVLDGGNAAWRAEQLPRVPYALLGPRAPGSLWVTRHRPKIDRIACPWLIRRFLDPDARFLFVPPTEVLSVAEKFDAVPFDVPGAPWTHDGALCTFDTMMSGFDLTTPPLSAMARVIRAADTNSHDLAPEAAGLLALSVGLSRAFSDDLEQLNNGMILYDALYRWARDGQTESHDWQEPSP
jgi:rhodanese-related sulfurtransferase